MSDEAGRPWTVALVCGASASGKSRVAVPLAARHGVPLAEADDILTALQAMTSPSQQPLLHLWVSNPEAALSWSPEKLAEVHFAIAEVLRPAFLAVIRDHLDFLAPAVFEGDYLLPDLASDFGGEVRALVISEPTEERLAANYLAREPATGEQRHRAEASAVIDAELVARANRCGVPVVPAWPWDTGLDRVDRALRRHKRS